MERTGIAKSRNIFPPSKLALAVSRSRYDFEYTLVKSRISCPKIGSRVSPPMVRLAIDNRVLALPAGFEVWFQ